MDPCITPVRQKKIYVVLIESVEFRGIVACFSILSELQGKLAHYTQ